MKPEVTQNFELVEGTTMTVIGTLSAHAERFCLLKDTAEKNAERCQRILKMLIEPSGSDTDAEELKLLAQSASEYSQLIAAQCEAASTESHELGTLASNTLVPISRLRLAFNVASVDRE